MEINKEMLQKCATQVLRTYKWGRFETLREEAERTGQPRGHDHYLGCFFFNELERNYRKFNVFLITGQGMMNGRSPHVWEGHLNHIKRLVDARRNGITVQIPEELLFKTYEQMTEAERRVVFDAKHPIGDNFVVFTFMHLGNERLDKIVYMCENWDELPIVMPVYFPDLVQKYKEAAESRHKPDLLWFYHTFEETLSALPPFPPKLHDIRIRIVEDTFELLNRFYEIVIDYQTKWDKFRTV